jgi:hypothetical protein
LGWGASNQYKGKANLAAPNNDAVVLWLGMEGCQMTNLINCGTCGYPLTPEERTSLIERNGVMVKPAPMTTERALDMALEAMERYQVKRQDFDRFADEITAIKQARALDKKAENARELGLDYEPHKGLSEHLAQATNGRVRIDPGTGDVGIGTPPAQPAPVQDEYQLRGTLARLKCWHRLTEEEADDLVRFAAAQPAQRQWVGLTEQEALDCFSPNPVTHSKNVEAKLKEKNNG